MTLGLVTCSLCNWKAEAHGYARNSIARGHVRECHPEAEAEVRAFELEVREKRKALREKYGNIVNVV
jgi:hypothetical protein